jgi:hypothetical protein
LILPVETDVSDEVAGGFQIGRYQSFLSVFACFTDIFAISFAARTQGAFWTLKEKDRFT